MPDTPQARATKQEYKVAKRVGGRRNPGSGNGWKHKNDVRHDECLFEMKRTDKRSITVKLSDLGDLAKNAALAFKIPVFHIEIGSKRYVLVEEDDFFE